MDWAKINNFSIILTIITSLLFIEEWVRRKLKERSISGEKPSSEIAASKWNRFVKTLPVLIVVCCMFYTISGAIWMHHVKIEAGENKSLTNDVSMLANQVSALTKMNLENAKTIENYKTQIKRLAGEGIDIPASNPDYETILSNKITRKLEEGAASAYKSGDNAYVVVFLELLKDRVNGDQTWQCNYPLYSAAELKQNPTAKGYEVFCSRMSAMLTNMNHDVVVTHGGYFRYREVFEKALDNLRTVKTQIPKTEEKTITRIDEILKQAELIESQIPN